MLDMCQYPVTCPCIDCENRSISCHGNCSKYLEYKKKLEELKAIAEKIKKYGSVQ